MNLIQSWFSSGEIFYRYRYLLILKVSISVLVSIMLYITIPNVDMHVHQIKGDSTSESTAIKMLDLIGLRGL